MLQSKYKATYNDLVENVISKIKTICQNVDSLSSSIPSQMKNGAATNMARYSFNTATHGTQYLTVTSTVNDSAMTAVSLSTIRSDLNNFLNNHNLSLNLAKQRYVSNVFILNFFNSVASFIATHVKQVIYRYETSTSNYTTKAVVLYVHYDSPTYVNIASLNNANLNLSTSNISDVTTALCNCFKYYNRAASLQSTITYACSSSSSSCSSSSSSSCSSSSSSSSSSSFFIGFMKL